MGCPATLTLYLTANKEGFNYKKKGSHTCETISEMNQMQAAKSDVIVNEKYSDLILDIPAVDEIDLIHSENTPINWTERIHEPPLSLCVKSQLMFLHFDCYYRGIDETLERMIVWAHSKLVDYLSIKTSHFWDGTFYVSCLHHLYFTVIRFYLGSSNRIRPSSNFDDI